MSATRVELTGTAQNKGLTLTKLVATPLGELRCHVAAAADAARYSRYNADVFTESSFGNRAPVAWHLARTSGRRVRSPAGFSRMVVTEGTISQ